MNLNWFLLTLQYQYAVVILNSIMRNSNPRQHTNPSPSKPTLHNLHDDIAFIKFITTHRTHRAFDPPREQLIVLIMPGDFASCHGHVRCAATQHIIQVRRTYASELHRTLAGWPNFGTPVAKACEMNYSVISNTTAATTSGERPSSSYSWTHVHLWYTCTTV